MAGAPGHARTGRAAAARTFVVVAVVVAEALGLDVLDADLLVGEEAVELLVDGALQVDELVLRRVLHVDGQVEGARARLLVGDTIELDAPQLRATARRAARRRATARAKGAQWHGAAPRRLGSQARVAAAVGCAWRVTHESSAWADSTITCPQIRTALLLGSQGWRPRCAPRKGVVGRAARLFELDEERLVGDEEEGLVERVEMALVRLDRAADRRRAVVLRL